MRRKSVPEIPADHAIYSIATVPADLAARLERFKQSYNLPMVAVVARLARAGRPHVQHLIDDGRDLPDLPAPPPLHALPEPPATARGKVRIPVILDARDAWVMRRVYKPDGTLAGPKQQRATSRLMYLVRWGAACATPADMRRPLDAPAQATSTQLVLTLPINERDSLDFLPLRNVKGHPARMRAVLDDTRVTHKVIEDPFPHVHAKLSHDVQLHLTVPDFWAYRLRTMAASVRSVRGGVSVSAFARMCLHYAIQLYATDPPTD